VFAALLDDVDVRRRAEDLPVQLPLAVDVLLGDLHLEASRLSVEKLHAVNRPNDLDVASWVVGKEEKEAIKSFERLTLRASPRGCIWVPSMLMVAEVLSVPQSHTYCPLSLCSTRVRTRDRRVPSDLMTTILEAMISFSLRYQTTGTSLLNSQSRVTWSFSVAV